jgi:hypothetical protein
MPSGRRYYCCSLGRPIILAHAPPRLWPQTSTTIGMIMGRRRICS